MEVPQQTGSPIPTDRLIHLVENRTLVLSPTYVRADPYPKGVTSAFPSALAIRTIWTNQEVEYSDVEELR